MNVDNGCEITVLSVFWCAGGDVLNAFELDIGYVGVTGKWYLVINYSHGCM